MFFFFFFFLATKQGLLGRSSPSSEDSHFTAAKEETLKMDIRRWKYQPCSWIGRINMVNMAILSKAIYRFNQMPIKIPTQFFIDLKRETVNFIWKNKNSRIAKRILNNTRTSGEITISDLKLY